ncbi:hypothetical protein EDC44_10456 [Cricetibacter osteomyelitidis]|uniref:Lipoprotein n=1 Tax=Cricetibacter osteomyelitidis TaxID=1521931 RepID=A0A4V2T289_9PAST|nr:hypothetical protein [Cricetibacter osteomyelitidis]TCP96523.1 hypothetical protein EDC44_10456 [Cricetibacter osteomyelitidis]
MKFITITFITFFILGCLPFEPAPSGVFVTYNFCTHPIELKNDDVLESPDKNKKSSIININHNKVNLSFSSEELNKQIEKVYFIEEGMKKYFFVDIYKEDRVNLIDCPENAKSTGDGNWIRAK